MGTLFGTDGVRGRAGVDVTTDLAARLGHVFARQVGGASGSPRLAIAADPRESSPELAAAMAAGMTSAAATVVDLGTQPTPMLAWTASTASFDGGAMISASHNPYTDNGIKFFSTDGFKLSDDQEHALESALEQLAAVQTADVPQPVTDPDDEHLQAWIAHTASTIDVDLDGLHVVVDCANGAASVAAPHLYETMGARVTAIHAEPTGTNINDGCGSTHPEVIAKATVEAGADLGIAHDGDADRVIAVAADGSIVDGDSILAILAIDRADRGVLKNSTVVTTVMTNLGFRLAMADRGINVEITDVGDRYVLERMRADGHSLGGEQSGHIIQLDRATTGDGLLTAASLMAVMKMSGKPLSELAGVMQRLPQELINVVVDDKSKLEGATEIWDAVKAAEAELGDTGRVLLRPSGTEAKIRVMVEAPTDADAHRHASAIADLVREQL